MTAQRSSTLDADTGWRDVGLTARLAEDRAGTVVHTFPGDPGGPEPQLSRR
jgi:hypothetical protein